jgi:hypothetical protein
VVVVYDSTCLLQVDLPDGELTPGIESDRIRRFRLEPFERFDDANSPQKRTATHLHRATSFEPHTFDIAAGSPVSQEIWRQPSRHPFLVSADVIGKVSGDEQISPVGLPELDRFSERSQISMTQSQCCKAKALRVLQPPEQCRFGSRSIIDAEQRIEVLPRR